MGITLRFFFTASYDVHHPHPPPHSTYTKLILMPREPFKTIIEPFKIKMVEPIPFTLPEVRRLALERAAYNLFAVPAREVTIDLLTDSGTGAMSAAQWSALMGGDESYAGSDSFFRFEETIKSITGFRHIIPTHQGRAAEHIFFSLVAKPGDVIPNNTHFDTTRANVEVTGARADDLLTAAGHIPSSRDPFKGNMDVKALERLIQEVGREHIPVCLITVTNNAVGGQPVSMENLHAVKRVLKASGIPLFLDACRFAENAYFIKQREEGYQNKTPYEIAREMFSLADGCLMSAKKDGIANIGGFLALNDSVLAERARHLLILTEGFPTYGGLAGRDLDAIAVGLTEALDEHYLAYRLAVTEYMAKKLRQLKVALVEPPGGHAVYLDAAAFYPHIPSEAFPAQTLVCELYLEGGVRSVEVGSVMMGRRDPETKKEIPAPQELVRLAIPRRVYTQSHMDYVLEVIARVQARREQVNGLEFTFQAPRLRHFTACFQPLTRSKG